MNKDLMDKFFPKTSEKIINKICPTCGKDIGKFKDELSEKEYLISGMCQNCQDSIFD